MNARIDAMIEKYRPEEDKKKYGYTAFVKPIRDTYRNYESVERMRNIMTVLGLAILFIAALNTWDTGIRANKRPGNTPPTINSMPTTVSGTQMRSGASSKERLEASAAFHPVCRGGIHLRTDVRGDGAVSICAEQGYGV